MSMVLIRCCTEDFQRLKHGYADISQSRVGHIYSHCSVRAVPVSEVWKEAAEPDRTELGRKGATLYAAVPKQCVRVFTGEHCRVDLD